VNAETRVQETKDRKPTPRSANCPSDQSFLLAGDENAAAGRERAAEANQVEAPARAIHVRVRHADDADRIRPPGVLADCINPPPLFHLLGMVVGEASEIAGVTELETSIGETHGRLFARLADEVRFHPETHLANTGASVLETLWGDVRVGVPKVYRTDGALDQPAKADRLVVGDQQPSLLG